MSSKLLASPIFLSDDSHSDDNRAIDLASILISKTSHLPLIPFHVRKNITNWELGGLIEPCRRCPYSERGDEITRV